MIRVMFDSACNDGHDQTRIVHVLFFLQRNAWQQEKEQRHKNWEKKTGAEEVRYMMVGQQIKKAA